MTGYGRFLVSRTPSRPVIRCRTHRGGWPSPPPLPRCCPQSAPLPLDHPNPSSSRLRMTSAPHVHKSTSTVGTPTTTSRVDFAAHASASAGPRVAVTMRPAAAVRRLACGVFARGLERRCLAHYRTATLADRLAARRNIPA
eukprot:1189936-Prorocentrum_minimum.AAC.1